MSTKKDLQTNDDGLIPRPAGFWAEQKLSFLAAYMDRFIVSMRKKPWRGIHYIDIFSGPGKNRLENGEFIQGSPLIALTRESAFDRYFFSDIDPQNIQALDQRCLTLAQNQYQKIEFDTGDANVLVDKIADKIKQIDEVFIKGAWSSLNLAFLDPEGLELH